MKEIPSKLDFKEIVKSFKKDKVSNANKIIDLLKEIQNGETKRILGAVGAIHKIFIILLKDRSIKSSELPDDLQEATEKYANWLYIQYEETHKILIELLSHSAATVRELSLCSIVKLIQAEGRNPITQCEGYPFPRSRLAKLIKTLVSDTVDNQQLISRLQEYTEYQDFLFFTIRTLAKIVNQHKEKELTEVYINNVFTLLEQIDIPDGGKFPTYQTLLEDAQPASGSLTEGDEEESVKSEEGMFVFNYEEIRRHLNGIWIKVVRYQLSLNVYRRCLVLIPEKAIHHLNTPVKLADFFIEAYNLGGAFSLLALQGVFILINKYNLDYPSFYAKLYSLLEPTVFNAKYKPRFFMLLNLFLSSTHLPEYLVAAFIKRLSRLSLEAPAHSLVLITKFIANLLVRFPSLKKLINNDVQSIEEDPYRANEADPVLSKASSSSLWEIATLKYHVNPVVSKAAAFVERNPPDMEHDLSPFVETTDEDVFQKATTIKMKEIPTTFHKPQSLFIYKDDQMSDTWSLD